MRPSFARFLVHGAVAVTIAGCAGTTELSSNHPALAPAGAEQATAIYFIRPDPGFRGVQNLPVTISVDGEVLLRLAKGHYTVLHFKPQRIEVKAEGYTVEGPSNTMTKLSMNTELTLTGGEPRYLLFGSFLRGRYEVAPFVITEINRAEALLASRSLVPFGPAAAAPLAP